MNAIRLTLGDRSLTAEIADSFLTRGRGLLGRPTLPEGHGLLIRPCASVHTCLMRQPLDLVGLREVDGDKLEVTWLSQNVAPWRFRMGRNGTKQILELAAGEVERLHLWPGDRLSVETLA